MSSVAVVVKKVVAPVNDLSPAIVWAPVVTTPRAVAEASGTFKVSDPPSAAGLPDTPRSVPEVPSDRPIVELAS